MLMDTVQRMGHLMRRAGFGATQAELQRRAGQGIDAAIKDLLDGAQQPDDGGADWFLNDMMQRDREGRLRPPMLKPWWIYRMVTTDRPLQEKMVLFWHGHFATSASKVNPAELMLQQNRFFRENALGNWRDILKGISRDAAMILWLDNNTNYKEHPNENYGRELMELFSLGIGHYTEDDVKQGARAFTGWTQNRGDFSFNANQHDTGIKTFLGRTGNFDGDDIVDIILQQPAAAEFLARKLWTFFAYENPEPEVVSDMADALRAGNFEVRALMEAMFKHEAFWSPRAVGTQVKSPTQLVVGSLRALGIGQVNLQAVQTQGVQTQDGGNRMDAQNGNRMDAQMGTRSMGAYAMAANFVKQMAQDLFFPPNVKGWDGGAAWINSATMLARINFASRLAALAGPGDGPGGIESLAGQAAQGAPDALVDAVLANLGPLDLRPEQRQTIIKGMGGGTMQLTALRGYQRTARVRSAVALAMQTPQYQLC